VIEEDAAGGLDFRALCDATEGSDAVAQLGFYSDEPGLASSTPIRRKARPSS
jgi:hypothetical protein